MGTYGQGKGSSAQILHKSLQGDGQQLICPFQQLGCDKQPHQRGLRWAQSCIMPLDDLYLSSDSTDPLAQNHRAMHMWRCKASQCSDGSCQMVRLPGEKQLVHVLA